MDLKKIIKGRIERIILLIGMIIIMLYSKSANIALICFSAIIISEIVGWLYGSTSL